MTTRRPMGKRTRVRIPLKKGTAAPTPPPGGFVQDNLNSGGGGINADITDDLNSGGGGAGQKITP